MAVLERIGDIHYSPDGAVVYAEADREASQARVVCSFCPALKDMAYGSEVNAFLAATYHAVGDADQGHTLNSRGI